MAQETSDLQKQIELLEREHERLSRAKADLLKSLGVTEEEIQKVLSNPASFPPGQWEEFCEMRKKMIEEIERDIASIPDPKKTEQTRKKMNLPSYALFCR